MGEDKQIDRLKKECYKLYKFKDDPAEYEKAAYDLEKKVTALRLNHIVEPLELSYSLLLNISSFPASPTEFEKRVDKLLEIKKMSFFFQLPQLVGFPDNYHLGHGKLRKFDSLPAMVRDFATGLTNGKVGKVRTEEERIQTVFLHEMQIPRNPHVGCWLEIKKSGIGSFMVCEKALQAAEESLDILRVLRSHIRISLPQYAISKNSDERKVSFNALKIELYDYHFDQQDQQEQKSIDRLNKLVARPRSELEKRVLNAFHFYRIGRNFSPEDQELFYYVAAIENLIIGKDDRDLGWKFSERAAFLLEDDLIGRLEVVGKLRGLYRQRSAIAHGGIFHGKTSTTQMARDYLVRIIEKILELIDKRGLKGLSSKKKDDSLDEYIDGIKYSGKHNPQRKKMVDHE
jgi:hypothetical protein